MLSVMWRKKKGSHDEQRLKILDKFVRGNSNALINMKPIFYMNEVGKSEDGIFCQDHEYSNCFLVSCHLCHKPLSLDKEVYMYRGDLGFCSVKCRNRQMYLDDMKKIEVSARRILASFHQRRRHGGGRCEIRDVRGVLPPPQPAAPPIFI